MWEFRREMEVRDHVPCKRLAMACLQRASDIKPSSNVWDGSRAACGCDPFGMLNLAVMHAV